jgi:hypothetical protein
MVAGRAQARLHAGAVVVFAPSLFRGCIVVHHAVYISGGGHKRKPRTPKAHEIGFGMPVRLRKNGNAISKALQITPDQRCAEGRMVDVGVARNQYEVCLTL